ncbi:hypothetical protein [Herbaspirillum sp. ST 5-3]|uniref:hypothetical protein n=1 Tax=Oxalobacteraceae TaxID=75682 RepID=UPI0010A3B9DB|nr:hypothetical protein [Herbaspirillum sp. ST 5-3]
MRLQEITQVRQLPGDRKRRWFTSDTMDLIVWMDAQGDIDGFQLCYDKGRTEKALHWTRDRGLSHMLVDDGEGNGALSYKASPMLRGGAPRDIKKTGMLFEHAAQALPRNIKEFVLSKIEDDAASAGDPSRSHCII